MPAYIIVDIEITDPAGYEEYKKLAGETVEKYGGKVLVGKVGLPGVAWFAVCQDSEGNTFAIFQPDPAVGEPDPTVGAVHADVSGGGAQQRRELFQRIHP